MNINFGKSIISMAAAILLTMLPSCHPSKTELTGTEGNAEANIAEEEDSLFMFDVSMQGKNTDEIFRNLIEQTEEFDYYDNERTEITRLNFCGVPFGINPTIEEKNGTTRVTIMNMITSHQSTKDFEAIKKAVSKRYGEPIIDDYDCGTVDFDETFIGRTWDEGGVMIRNLHSEEGGMVCFIYSYIK
jgi:hypothetical protein